MIFLILLLLLIGCISLLIIKQLRMYNEMRSIPGPTPLPFVGNALEFGSGGTDFLTTLQNLTQRYGSIVRLCIGPQNGILLTDPNYIDEVFTVAQYDHKGDFYNVLKPLIGNGLASSSGETWLRHRRILNKSFGNKQLDKYVVALNAVVNDLVDELKEKVHFDYVNITEPVFCSALNAVCKTTMNVDIKKNTEYHTATLKLFDLIVKRFTSPLKRIDFYYRFTEEYRQTMKCVSTMHNTVNNVIDGHIKLGQAEPTGSSVLDQLIRLNGQDTLSKQEMQDQIQTFVIGGSDTVGTAISFAIYELAKHPDVQEKILEEIQFVLGTETKEDLNFEDLQELKYTERVIKEILRLYTPVPLITRIVPHEIYLGKFRIPAKTTAIIFLYGLHTSEEVYPDPQKFDPDRFLPENCEKRNAFGFVPFANGRKNCIGQKFAMLEVKLTLAKIVRNFRLSQHPGHTPALSLQCTLISTNGLPVVLKLRKS